MRTIEEITTELENVENSWEAYSEKFNPSRETGNYYTSKIKKLQEELQNCKK